MTRLIDGGAVPQTMSSSVQRSFASQSLFGGALTMDLASHYTDVSELRQVPDHQEVFIEQDATNSTASSSLIIELLEMTDWQLDHGEPARYHFWQLAEENEVPAEASQLSIFQRIPLDAEKVQARHLPADVQISIAVGVQACAKFNQVQRDIVNIYLGLIRIPSQQTDILVTLNQPYRLQIPQADIQSLLMESSRLLEQVVTNSVGDPNDDNLKCVQAFQEFQKALHSLAIHDYSLFNTIEHEQE